jgi:hypothetical protein
MRSCTAPFLQLRGGSEVYDGGGEGRAGRCYFCRAFDARLLCSSRVPRCRRARELKRQGAIPSPLAARGLRRAFVRGVCSTLFQKKSACAKRSRVGLVLFWTAFAVVVLVILFPQAVASLIAGSL